MNIIAKNKKNGFTIVELLIVIVIIGILAAITIVAYNGITARSRDSQRVNDLAAIKKALLLYNIDNGNYVENGSGCGYQNTGSGWFNAVDGGSYTKSISTCIKDAGYIKSDIIDPTKGTTSNPTSGYAYMKYQCGSGDTQRVFVYAKLESKPQDSTATDGTCQGALDSSYGMNYYVQVK